MHITVNIAGRFRNNLRKQINKSKFFFYIFLAKFIKLQKMAPHLHLIDILVITTKALLKMRSKLDLWICLLKEMKC
jgi:hypothetical protein